MKQSSSNTLSWHTEQEYSL